MAQYKQIKAQHKDCILMFRLGDFYEMFFQDAVDASKILQITLTSRNKGSAQKVPMCGIPFHAIDNYLGKLTRVGKKVAICDQITPPDGKNIVERKVIRIVTPGTTFDENIIEQKNNNYIACIVAEKDCFGFSYADITTGEFKTTQIKNAKELQNEILRINPAECICEENIRKNLQTILKENIYIFNFQYNKDFSETEDILKNHFEIKSLKGFGLEDKPFSVLAVGMLFEYLKETQKTDLKHIQQISFYEISEFMILDEALIRNLELFYSNQNNEKQGSLISVLDKTMNPMGGRMLKNWLKCPLIDKTKIESRLNSVEIFVKNSSLLRNIRENLNGIYDMERLLSKLSLGTGNARDLIAMKFSLQQIPKLKELIKENLKSLNQQLDSLYELVELIEKSINEEPPATIREGGMIKNGYNKELDELRNIGNEGKNYLKNLQEREIKRTGISSLKVKFNNVFGYYIEISKTNLASVPDDYIRKQTLVNAERFITPELKEYEDKILNAEDKIKELEYELFYEVRMNIVKEIVKIQNNARAIGALDVLSNLAFIAVKYNYCKPEILENQDLNILNARHPVIENMLLSNEFVPNNCDFNENCKFLLITGPNMGGKSTYLRQIAIIVLLAQLGSFVPAEKAEIGLVDRIFTRVGASDNLSRGESTFMVEMTETAYILNHATEKSLIILDEVGRGTSTYDGVSIAWAISEFIHDNIKAKTLFATHYHELIELIEKMEKAENLSVAVRENEKEGVVFLYKLIEGGINKSYGIEVSKLAGLPVEIVSRARGVLSELETKHINRKPISKDQMKLFMPEIPREHKEIISELSKMDVDSITPLDALSHLAKFKKKL